MGWLEKLFGSSTGGPAAAPSLAGERVLVADPSMTIQKVVELTLASEGCSVSFAGTGDEAIASLKAPPPTVVIASTDLPGKGGLQVCETIRRRPDLGSTIVLILRGALEEPVDDSRLRVAGSDGILTKPFEPGQLIEQIRTARTQRALRP